MLSYKKNNFISKVAMFTLLVVFALVFTTGAQAALVVDFSQGANKNPVQGDVVWIRGILQQSNSTYYEGMSSLQRIIFLNIPKTPPDHVHTLTLSHLANKSTDNHAYDFITSWPQALQAGTEIGGPTMFVNLNECGPQIGPPEELADICDALHASGFTAAPDCPDTMGSLIGDDVASKVAAYEAHFGNRTVKIYGNVPISAASMSFEGYNGLVIGDDMYADYTLTWTSSSDSIVIELAGHLAVGLDPLQAGIGYGEGRGSSSISGGPYHFKLYQLDGASLGNQDNQIQGADIELPPPVCYVTPESDSVCAGGSAIFEAEVIGGTPPYTWEWTKPPDPTVLSTDSSLTISDATPADAGQYQAVMIDDGGLTDTCYVDLTVWSQPVCDIVGGVDSLEVGDTTIWCAKPDDMKSYEWSEPVSGFTSTEQCVEIGAGLEIGTYTFTVIVTDYHDCADTCSRDLKVKELVPVVLARFEALGGKGSIALSWITASEINCHGWEIYRGKQEDGEYAKMGELSGHGSTETAHAYRWVDRQVQPGATYFYKLKQVDFDGSSTWSHVVSATAGSAVPETYALSQNYPNPFNANTEIRYQTPKDGQVTLKIYNTLGEEVRTLVDADQKANWYGVTWDGRDNMGSEVASGLYFCTIKAGDFTHTRKMVLMR